ncbi:DHA2 family metal-tetracycline-proton antiporter-like MFS transporter [Bacillus oleivorans]|uniref:Tetracycline resistance protein n=1 Tax=Bacillus oleivorans TaxID=1448271 RepID=A0A285D6T6_9BACI|nr:MFS transporter [Bacillus oleivorans]SNX75529.1 DHA2 family metal-tetracycline-proton antiporter-like MFS transporter [Bacillus oleivorans]
MTTIARDLNAEHSLTQSEKKKIIFLICSVLLFSVMNGTMFMIAIPDIAASFSLLPSQVSWVVTGYIILYAIGALMYGKLADIYPLKTILTIGLCLFATGSIAGFFAPNFLMVVFARMIQATGAASIIALVFIVPSRYFPEEKGRVLGIVSSTMAFASGIGPVIGGLIAGALNWQFLFLISAFVLLTIPFFGRFLPKEEKQEGKVDLLGALLIAIAVAALILFITLFVWWYIIISFVFFGLFTWRIFHSDNPFIRPDMFRNAPYRTTIFAGFLAIMTMFGMMFMLPLLLSEVNDLNTLFIGLTLFPGAMAAAFTGRFAGSLADQRGGKQVAYIAMALMIAGFLLLSTFIGSPAWVISLVVIISYMAFPFLQTATASLISAVLPRNEIGVGMGIYNLFNFMSGAFGSAVIGKVLDYESGVRLNPISAADGHAAIYSNVFIGLAVLTILNVSYFYLSFKRIKV